MSLFKHDDRLGFKYREKGFYVVHPQLVTQIADGIVKGVVFYSLVLFLIYRLAFGGDPRSMASLDFYLTVLTLIFTVFVAPFIFKGKIVAFYRRDYDRVWFATALIKFFVEAGVIRTCFVALYYWWQIYKASHSPRQYYVEYMAQVHGIIFNPQMALLAVAVFLLSLYILFYQERYISIRDFSNAYVEIFNSRTRDKNSIVYEILRRRDADLGIVDTQNIKYDGNKDLSHHVGASDIVSTPAQTHEDAVRKEIFVPSSNGSKKSSSEDVVPIRRKSRR